MVSEALGSIGYDVARILDGPSCEDLEENEMMSFLATV